MASFWIEFEQGGELHKASFESESISIGRDRSSDFILDHPTVSRQHALIVHQGGGSFQLVVLSRGGLTAVENESVRTQEVDLYDGTLITLGEHRFRFRSAQARPKPGPQGQAMGGGGAVTAPVEVPEDPKEDVGGPGIISWDEIAASSAASDKAAAEEEAAQVGETDFDRIRKASANREKGTNPVLVGGAAIICVAVLVAVFLGSGSEETAVIQKQIDPNAPKVEIDVSCPEPNTCQRNALQAYERAVDLLESRDVETGNLFEAYKRLLEAKALLEAGGVTEFPDEMQGWQEHHDVARGDLDAMFRDFKMRYHQASTRKRYQDMVQVLRTIEAFFPDRTSIENRWARDKELEMKSAGIYSGRY